MPICFQEIYGLVLRGYHIELWEEQETEFRVVHVWRGTDPCGRFYWLRPEGASSLS